MTPPKKTYEKKLQIDKPFDEALERFGQTDPKEITKTPKKIKVLAPKSTSKEITSLQGSFDLGIVADTEVGGIGMGVLEGGVPYLNQRGLAALCGVENAHIGAISRQWTEEVEKPRIRAIKTVLEKSGDVPETPHFDIPYKGVIHLCYPGPVCLAIMEYYAFDAGANCQPEARDNFRLLAGKGLQDFIYAQVGYDPDHSIPEVWKAFHDRVSLTYDAVPHGYFGVFKEIADMIVTLGQVGLHLDAKFVPDASVGRVWSDFWRKQNLAEKFGERRRYEHNFPDYFPQAASNPQDPLCYPEAALGEFRRWFRQQYIGEGKFATYITKKAKQKELPTSVAQLAIKAYENKGMKQLK